MRKGPDGRFEENNDILNEETTWVILVFSLYAKSVVYLVEELLDKVNEDISMSAVLLHMKKYYFSISRGWQLLCRSKKKHPHP